MPYDERAFIAAARTRQESIRDIMPWWYVDKALPTWGEEFSYGFELYDNAQHGMLGLMVLGDESIRTDEDLLANLGATSVTTPGPVRRVITGDAQALRRTRGAVLNEHHWWPFFNDCWVLGGIHGGMEFHLGRDEWPPDKELWDARNRRPKMLGRELLILSLAGYEMEDAGNLGMVFHCTDPDRAAGIGLQDIYDADIGSNGKEFIKRIRTALTR